MAVDVDTERMFVYNDSDGYHRTGVRLVPIVNEQPQIAPATTPAPWTSNYAEMPRSCVAGFSCIHWR